ncbi:MAG: hypothetical protein ACI4WX_00820 [Aristaeellaceae bacterium]
MRAKAYLKQLRMYDRIITARISKKQRMMESATKVTPTMRTDGAKPGGGNQDKIGSLSCDMADLERTIDFYVDKLADLRTDVMLLLARMKHERQREVLYYRYMQYLSWGEIAEKMGYKSIRGAMKVHGQALSEFEKVMEEVKVHAED